MFIFVGDPVKYLYYNEICVDCIKYIFQAFDIC